MCRGCAVQKSNYSYVNSGEIHRYYIYENNAKCRLENTKLTVVYNVINRVQPRERKRGDTFNSLLLSANLIMIIIKKKKSSDTVR